MLMGNFNHLCQMLVPLFTLPFFFLVDIRLDDAYISWRASRRNRQHRCLSACQAVPAQHNQNDRR